MSVSAVVGASRAPRAPRLARLASDTYRAQFGGASDGLALAWAPGRINLIGEHTDYNEGFVLPAAINRLVALAGRPADEPFATLYSARHRERLRVRLSGASRGATEDDNGAPIPIWARYIQAVWRQLALRGATPPTVLGFSAAVVGDVPMGAGLSSSAALEVATAMFARALGGAPLAPMATAQACQQAEQEGAGVRVGVMDQAASCLGQPHQAIALDCRTLDYRYVSMRLRDAAWVVFDTRVPHSLAASEYNERRAQCEAAVARLAPTLEGETTRRAVHALRDVTSADLARHGALLGETLLRRARHVVSENERTLRAAETLRNADAEGMGALLNASHASLRDDFAVSCHELDAAVDITQSTPGALGARMMGAGFGGSILALVRREAVATLVARLATYYPLRTGGKGMVVQCAITGQSGIRDLLVGA